MVEQMKELGLFGATIGQEYGGLGLSATHLRQDREHDRRDWMSLTGIFNSHLIMAAASSASARQEQKSTSCRASPRGELRGGLALTEPDAGTDLQAIRTVRASATATSYVVNGTKTWITNGIHGTVSRCWSRPIPKPRRATRA